MYEVVDNANKDEDVYYPIDDMELKYIESKTSSSGFETTLVVIDRSNIYENQIEFEKFDGAGFSDVRYLITEQELAKVSENVLKVDISTSLKILSAILIITVVYSVRIFWRKSTVRSNNNDGCEESSSVHQSKYSSVTSFLVSGEVVNNLSDIEKFSRSLFHLSALREINFTEFDNVMEILGKIENRFIAPLRFLEEKQQSDTDFEITCFYFCEKILFSWERVCKFRLNIESLHSNCEMQRCLHNFQRAINASDVYSYLRFILICFVISFNLFRWPVLLKQQCY